MLALPTSAVDCQDGCAIAPIAARDVVVTICPQPARRDGSDDDELSCVTIVHWHFQDRSPLLISDDEHCTTGYSSIRDTSLGELSHSSRRFLDCFFDIGEFDAYLVKDGHLAAFKMEIVARQHGNLPSLRRSSIRELIDPHLVLHSRDHARSINLSAQELRVRIGLA